MDATYKAALEGAAFTSFTAVSIGGSVYLVDGADITISAQLYTGLHATYGALGEVEPVSDGADGQATLVNVTLLPPSMAAIGTFLAAFPQGTAINIYQGAVNTSTGAVIGTPEQLLQGELDVAEVSIGEGSFGLTLRVITEMTRLLERNEERKMSDAHHQSCFSGELGENFANGLVKKINWRVSDPASSPIKSKPTLGNFLK